MADATGYRLEYASPAVESRFFRYLAKLNRSEQQRLADRIESLGHVPRPPGKPFRILKPPVEVGASVAQYRLRIGDHRILYDVLDVKRVVILIAIRRRSEDTYD